MSVYRRKDSPYYWLCLEGVSGEKSAREATRIASETGDKETDRSNLALANEMYHIRMAERTRQRMAGIKPKVKRGAASARWSYVYFITDGERVKIGRAINVGRRLMNLQVGSHKPFTVMAAVPGHPGMELEIQRAFQKCRVAGEWFAFTPDLLRFIELVNAGRHPAAILPTLTDATVSE